MRLNKIGRIVRDEWYRSVEIRREVTLDEFIVMPNHLHGIVAIEDVTAAGGDRRSPLHRQGPASRSLGSFVAGFKSAATRRVHEAQLCSGPIWQRNYFEHIVRSEKSLNTIRAYTAGNPNNWSTDRENPNAKVLLSSQADRG
jgi:REP element-mobilizing transposase RayT